MFQFRPLAYEHLLYLKPQIEQTFERSELLSQPHAKEVLQANVGLSAWHNERIVGAAGLLNAGHRAVAWTLLSEEASYFMLPITRQIMYVLATYPAKRFEMVVLEGFEPAHQWARMLGFQCETPQGMRNFFSNGATGVLYARTK